MVWSALALNSVILGLSRGGGARAYAACAGKIFQRRGLNATRLLRAAG